MGLIEDFEYDIFISYAHDDNLGHLVKEPAEGWVLDFAKTLKKGLSIQLRREIEKTGRQLEIFWDKSRLQHGEPLDWELNDHVEKSAIFCIFMSQNYLYSNWCKQELDWFLKTLENRKDMLSRESAGRLWPVIVVSVGPTAQRDWPDEILQRGMPFEFFDRNEHSRDPRHAYPSIAVTPDPNFYEEFTKLETTLSRRIKKALAKEAAPMEAAAALVSPFTPDEPVDGASVVLLATDDLAQKAGRIEAKCAELGVGAVRPGADSEDAVEAALAGASALVLMLGVFPGADDEQKTRILRSAVDLAEQRGIPVIPWMQKGISPALIDDDFADYKQFAKEMEPSLIAGGLEELTAKIAELGKSGDAPEAEAVQRRIKLFIDAAKIDIEIARQIQERLQSSNIKARTYLPQVDADQRTHNQQWNSIVEKCDGIILVYGRIDIDAIDEKLDQIWRLSAKRKANKMAEVSVAILDAPPPSGFDVSEPGVQVITAQDESDFAAVEDFIASLQARAGSDAAV